jgi:anti-sigma-K factor RskA
MTCDQRQDEHLLDAFGALPPAESAALRTHLATGCSSCASSAAEALAIAAQFSRELAPVSPHPQVLDDLLDRVRTSTHHGRTIATAPRSTSRARSDNRLVFRWFPALTAVATAAALASVITAGIMWSQLRDERLLRTPDLRYVTLSGSNPQPKARGRIFWDADRGYWHVYVFDLTPPPSGKAYELWFIGNDGRKTAAGLFDVDAGGQANLVVKVPAALGSLAAAAVTDESAGGASQPAGSIQLLGKIE